MTGILSLNRSLSRLDIAANNLSGEAETTLLSALEGNKKIQNIDLRNTRKFLYRLKICLIIKND